jgi:hypothetical protein
MLHKNVSTYWLLAKEYPHRYFSGSLSPTPALAPFKALLAISELEPKEAQQCDAPQPLQASLLSVTTWAHPSSLMLAPKRFFCATFDSLDKNMIPTDKLKQK